MIHLYYAPFAVFAAIVVASLAGSTYATNILLALDCVGTALIGGWPGENLSSYAYRLDQLGKRGGRITRPAIDWLFAWQRVPGGHCYGAYVNMRSRLSMPPEMR